MQRSDNAKVVQPLTHSLIYSLNQPTQLTQRAQLTQLSAHSALSSLSSAHSQLTHTPRLTAHALTLNLL